jgi:hypothetical protein
MEKDKLMTLFSKQHYEKIAETIATKIIYLGPNKYSESDFAIEQIIKMLEEDNPKFNHQKFEKACGYTP